MSPGDDNFEASQHQSPSSSMADSTWEDVKDISSPTYSPPCSTPGRWSPRSSPQPTSSPNRLRSSPYELPTPKRSSLSSTTSSMSPPPSLHYVPTPILLPSSGSPPSTLPRTPGKHQSGSEPCNQHQGQDSAPAGPKPITSLRQEFATKLKEMIDDLTFADILIMTRLAERLHPNPHLLVNTHTQ